MAQIRDRWKGCVDEFHTIGSAVLTIFKGKTLIGLAFRNGSRVTYLPPLFSDIDCPLVGTNTSYAHGGF